MNELPHNKESSSVGNPGEQVSIRKQQPESDENSATTDETAGSLRIVSEEDSSAEIPQRLLFMPPIDIFDTEQGLVLRADLPGVCVERLDLQIEDNKLTLFGRVEQDLPEQAELIHSEYQVGDFYRSFILSDEVDYEHITAKINSGVLEVYLPRIPRTKPRKIQVQSE